VTEETWANLQGKRAEPPSDEEKRAARWRWLWFAGTGVGLVVYALGSGLVQIERGPAQEEDDFEEND
jgi:hypothetical protein